MAALRNECILGRKLDRYFLKSLLFIIRLTFLNSDHSHLFSVY